VYDASKRDYDKNVEAAAPRRPARTRIAGTVAHLLSVVILQS
jgi:hypothetical protein